MPWYVDSNNWVRAYLERTSQKVVLDYSFGGTNGSTNFTLPSTFAYLPTDSRASSYGEQYHMLKVYKNGSRLSAQVDHYWVNNDQPLLIRNEMLTAGRVGLAANQSSNWVDNLTVSPGWEEYGTNINGWSGSWTVNTNGITSPASGQQIVTKGDSMLSHEFSGYLDTGTLPTTGKAGLVVEQIDSSNYVTADVNYSNRMLELTAVVGGQTQLLGSTVARRDTIYGYSNFNGVGQTQYNYVLRGTAAVSRVRPLWLYGNYANVGLTYLLPNFSLTNFNVKTWNGAAWQSQPLNYTDNGRGIFGDAVFSNTVTTTQIQLNVPANFNRPEAFAVREEVSSQNFIRALRQSGQIYVWVNNELVFNVADPFASQPGNVGLFSQSCATTFQNLTCFQIPTSGQFAPAVPNESSVPAPSQNYLFENSNGIPRGLILNVNNQPAFAVSFYRRIDDDSLNYQVVCRTNLSSPKYVLWTDAMPYTNAVPIDSQFEKITCVYPSTVPTPGQIFLQVVVTRR